MQDRAIVTTADHMIYQLTPFSMTLNNPNPDFKVTPIFDAEYISNGGRYRDKHSAATNWNNLRMTLETVALLASLSVNLKVIFLALSILPSHVSPQRLRITFCYIWRFISFFILYCIVLDYCNAVLVGLPTAILAPLQRVLHAAARLVLDLRPRDHVTPALPSGVVLASYRATS